MGLVVTQTLDIERQALWIISIFNPKKIEDVVISDFFLHVWESHCHLCIWRGKELQGAGRGGRWEGGGRKV